MRVGACVFRLALRLLADRTSATRWGASTARHRSWADSAGLKTTARAAARESTPHVTLVRSQAVENVDSIGFAVHGWIKWSPGS